MNDLCMAILQKTKVHLRLACILMESVTKFSKRSPKVRTSHKICKRLN